MFSHWNVIFLYLLIWWFDWAHDNFDHWQIVIFCFVFIFVLDMRTGDTNPPKRWLVSKYSFNWSTIKPNVFIMVYLVYSTTPNISFNIIFFAIKNKIKYGHCESIFNISKHKHVYIDWFSFLKKKKNCNIHPLPFFLIWTLSFHLCHRITFFFFFFNKKMLTWHV